MDLVRKLELVRTLRTLRIFAPRVRRIRTLSERCERCEFLGYPLKGVASSEIRTTCAVASCSEAKTGRGPEIRTSRGEKRENCTPSASRSSLRPASEHTGGSQPRTRNSFPLLAPSLEAASSSSVPLFRVALLSNQGGISQCG